MVAKSCLPIFICIMEIQIIQGKNFRFFGKIIDISTERDFEIYDIIKSVLYRKEYKPFITSFNKSIEYSYLYDNVWFPTQFLGDIKQKLSELDLLKDIKIIGEDILKSDIKREDFDRFVKTLNLPDTLKVDDEKYKFQQDSAFNALKHKTSRIEIGTSGGKTFITYMFCRYVNYHVRVKSENNLQKILIIVPSKILCTQLKNDFNEYQQFEKDKLIIETVYAGSKKVSDADIICGTYQSLCLNESDYFDDFRFVICDELHKAKAYSIKNEIYGKTKNVDYYFGMSGTFPPYKTLDYLHIVSMFGAVTFKKTVKELIDTGVSAPVKIHVIKLNYKADKEFSKSLMENSVTGQDKYFAEKEWFQNNVERNKIICKLLSSFTSNALILVDTVSYCDLLKGILTEYFNDSKDNSKIIKIIHGKVKDREEIIDEMRQTQGNFIMIATYATMSTGTSIKNIGQVYFVDGGKSNIRIRQSIGRGIRLDLANGKTHCDLFDFYDNMPYSSFAKHARERLKIYDEQKLPYKITEVNM